MLLLIRESCPLAPQAYRASQQGCSSALRGFTGQARHLRRPNSARAVEPFCCCSGDVPFCTAEGEEGATCESKAILLMHQATAKQARKTNKAVRTTELKAQSRERLSTQEERHFMPCYFLSVTGLLLIRTDTIFRQSVIFKLMVSLKIFSGSHCYSWHSSLLSLTLTQQSSYMCLVLSTCLKQSVVRTWVFCWAKRFLCHAQSLIVPFGALLNKDHWQ